MQMRLSRFSERAFKNTRKENDLKGIMDKVIDVDIVVWATTKNKRILDKENAR